MARNKKKFDANKCKINLTQYVKTSRILSYPPNTRGASTNDLHCGQFKKKREYILTSTTQYIDVV